MRPLVALDLSLTSTGVAWRTADGTIFTRVIRTEPGDNPSGYRKRRDGGHVWIGDENWRMSAIAQQTLDLVEKLDVYKPNEDTYAFKRSVLAESVPTRNARSIVTLAKLHGHVAHALGFDPVYVDPATVKKHITGHGDASKREVEKMIRTVYCPSVIRDGITEDEIDALAVLAWAIDQEEK